MKTILTLCFISMLFSCQQPKDFGSIERIEQDFDLIVNRNAKIEIIAEGFEWSEGPLWIDSLKMLLFSDVPTNTVYKWTEENGTEIYLKPSGYTGSAIRGGEMGSNGLVLNGADRLVLCQHGDRRMAEMNSDLAHPKSDFITIADTFQGKKLTVLMMQSIEKMGTCFLQIHLMV